MMVAGWAELKGRIGFPPSERGEQIMAEFEAVVKKVAESDPWLKEHPPKVIWRDSRKEGYELSPNEPIVQVMSSAVNELGKHAKLCASPAAGDGTYFTPRYDGYGGIPCVWYGPGGGGAHAADEHVYVDDVLTVTKVIALTLLKWCNQHT